MWVFSILLGQESSINLASVIACLSQQASIVAVCANVEGFCSVLVSIKRFNVFKNM